MTKFFSKTAAKYALFAVGLLAGGAMFTPQPVSAAAEDEIIVMAPRGVYREKVGRSATGAPIEEISLSRRVSTYGLDLRRSSDMNEMERRVRMTANEACEQLTKLYPIENFSTSDSECKSQAFKNGMEQVDMLAGR